MKKTLLLSLLVCVFLSGCLGGGRTPNVVAPNAKGDLGTVISLGVKVPIAVDTVRVDGEKTGIGGPRFRLWPLDFAILNLRHPISDACDATTGFRLGELTGGLRCAASSETWTFGGKATVSWEWFHGVSLFTGIEGIIHDSGWILGFDSGLTTGWRKSHGNLNEAKFGGDPDLLGTLVFGPSKPLITASRMQFDWSSSLTIGVPVDNGGNATLFMAPNIDVPIATLFEQYDCVGCDAAVSEFVPALKMGMMFGMTGTF